MRRIWDFHGGVHPPEHKQQSLGSSLKTLPLPQEVILPLNMHLGTPAEPAVKIGDSVLTAQVVARANGNLSAAVHASISGTVKAIEERPIPHPSGMSAPCIVIESDGLDTWAPSEPVGDFRQLAPLQLIEILKDSGLAGMGGAGFPTAVKLQPQTTIKCLILNGTECEPYITADHRLMLDRAEQIIQGALLLAYILGEPGSVLIGVENNKPDAAQRLKEACSDIGDNRIDIVTFPTKYPSGGEKQLVQILTGEEVKSGSLPADLGIVVQNVGTASAAWDAIAGTQPLIKRITTCTGNALKQQGNFEVRIGTPVQNLLDHCGFDSARAESVIMGGPMMGFAMSDLQAPVTKISNCILVPDRTETSAIEPAQPCIRCGHCAEVCPASLLPQQLFWYSETADHEKLKDYNLFDCIECGACSYVCPSRIPLVQYYRAAKGDIRQAQREKVKSDRARERFESRQLRLEKEASDREAKRAARMEAAKVRQNKADSSSESAPQNGSNDLVAQALARVSKGKEDPQAAQAKLERQRQTLQERVENTRTKIAAAETGELRSKFEAQLKNTERKLAAVIDQLQQLPPNINEQESGEKVTADLGKEHRETSGENPDA